MTQPAMETVYVNNLNDKVSLVKLKHELKLMFAKYGDIVLITAHKNLKMKGQAFITYNDIQAAENAVKSEANTVLFGKPLRITFARSNSDAFHTLIAKDDSVVEARKQAKAEKNSRKRKAEPTTSKAKRAKTVDWSKLPPNKILLLQNLSSSIGPNDVEPIFESFGGFVNIRLLKIRNLAFIEFDSETDATTCLNEIDKNQLNKLGEHCQLTYAKK
jgi:RNA recognition motif-containing protein